MIGQSRVQTLEVDLGSSPIDEWYIELESRFDIEAIQDYKLRFLCDAKDNLDSPIHSWFNLKEAFSARFPDWVISLLARTYGFVRAVV